MAIQGSTVYLTGVAAGDVGQCRVSVVGVADAECREHRGVPPAAAQLVVSGLFPVRYALWWRERAMILRDQRVTNE